MLTRVRTISFLAEISSISSVMQSWISGRQEVGIVNISLSRALGMVLASDGGDSELDQIEELEPIEISSSPRSGLRGLREEGEGRAGKVKQSF